MCWFGLVHPHVAQIVCATPADNINLLRDRVSRAWMAQEAIRQPHLPGLPAQTGGGGHGAGGPYRHIR